MLPIVFAVLGAGGLLLAMIALWQSLRAAFGAADTGTIRATFGSVARATLVDEKNALLRSLKDLQFERDIGKIDDADFTQLDKSLRARTREVMKLLDQDVEPYRADAEKLVRDHLKRELGSAPYRDRARDVKTVRCPECATPNDEDADWCKSCRTRLTPRACPKCATTNDPDAAFCKKCAFDFADDQDELPSDEEEAAEDDGELAGASGDEGADDEAEDSADADADGEDDDDADDEEGTDHGDDASDESDDDADDADDATDDDSDDGAAADDDADDGAAADDDADDGADDDDQERG